MLIMTSNVGSQAILRSMDQGDNGAGSTYQKVQDVGASSAPSTALSFSTGSTRSSSSSRCLGRRLAHRGPDAGVRDREGEGPGRVRGRRSGFQGPAPRGGVLTQVWRPAHAKDGAAAAGEPAERVPLDGFARDGDAVTFGADGSDSVELANSRGQRRDVQHGGAGRRRRGASRRVRLRPRTGKGGLGGEGLPLPGFDGASSPAR